MLSHYPWRGGRADSAKASAILGGPHPEWKCERRDAGPVSNSPTCRGLVACGFRLVLSLVGAFKGQLATKIGTELTSTLRSQMVTKLQSLAVAYYDRHQVGSMLSRVAHDSEALHGLMHQITGGFLLQVVQLMGVGAMLLWIHPKLAMFTLIPIPLVFLGHGFFGSASILVTIDFGTLLPNRCRFSTECSQVFVW